MLTIGSLFSGIGGLEFGLELAGFGPVIWQCEADLFCRSVLESHWPGVERYEDVRDLSRPPKADLICGGFPCQDISSAGKGAGLAGERSGLWFEFARIVDEVRPEWVVVENVASGAHRWVDAVCRELGRLCYATLPIPLSAADVGASHLRRRVFVVAHADIVRLEPREYGLRARQPDPEGRAIRDTDGPGLQGLARQGDEGRPQSPAGPWTGDAIPEPAICRVDGGPPSRVEQRLRNDRLKALGNVVVPQCAEVIGWVILELMEQRA